LSPTLNWFPALVADAVSSTTSTTMKLPNGTTLKTSSVGSANKCLTFRVNYARLFEVMRERKTFWNVVFKTRRNPEFTGKHVLASCNRVHTTFPIETKEEDMIELYKAEEFNMQWTNGDVYEVLGIHNIFEDRIRENDLRITHD